MPRGGGGGRCGGGGSRGGSWRYSRPPSSRSSTTAQKGATTTAKDHDSGGKSRSDAPRQSEGLGSRFQSYISELYERSTERSAKKVKTVDNGNDSTRQQGGPSGPITGSAGRGSGSSSTHGSTSSTQSCSKEYDALLNPSVTRIRATEPTSTSYLRR